LENPHKYIVERALSEGKTVPEKVLSEYPDLAEQVVGQIPTQPPATVEESIQTLFPNRVQVFPKREQPR
jgi:ATP-dependent exoDNAse (exonuclease V) alpha subunit